MVVPGRTMVVGIPASVVTTVAPGRVSVTGGRVSVTGGRVSVPVTVIVVKVPRISVVKIDVMPGKTSVVVVVVVVDSVWKAVPVPIIVASPPGTVTIVKLPGRV